MVTLRTYLNPTQALLDKTLLDSNENLLGLADQNANLYGGGPFAMPVRRPVAEEQAEEAIAFLRIAINSGQKNKQPLSRLSLPGRRSPKAEPTIIRGRRR